MLFLLLKHISEKKKSTSFREDQINICNSVYLGARNLNQQVRLLVSGTLKILILKYLAFQDVFSKQLNLFFYLHSTCIINAFITKM